MSDVTQIQADSKTAADQYIKQAESFLNNIASYVNTTIPVASLPPTLGLFLTETAATQILTELKSRRPTFTGSTAIGASAPVSPTAPTLGDPTTPSPLNIPDLTLNPPNLNTINPPAPLNQSFNKAAPEFRSPDMPARPNFTLPAAPVFSPLPLPEVPFVDFPIFTSTEPVDTIVAPTYTFNWSETDYTSTMLTALKAKVLADLQNGGYGIEISDERRLWERTRERELANASSKMAELQRAVEGRSLTLPPGAYFAMLGNAQQELISKTASNSREIAINKAQLYVENRKFTIQQAGDIEKALIQYQGFRSERALNAAKATVELGVAIFNAQVSKQNLKNEAYRIAAQVYEAKIRASVAKLEVFKTQVEAARVDAERQRVYAEVYKIQIEAINSLISAYRVDMEAAKVKADIEQTKLMAFKTEIEGYLALVQAKDTEFKMYTAQLGGEETKVRLYKGQIEAHTSRVQAFKVRSDIDLQTTQIKVENNRILLEKYRADMQRYTTDINAKGEEIRANINKFQGDISLYGAEADVIGKGLDLTRQVQTVNSEIYMKSFDAAVVNAKFQFDTALKANEFRLKAAEMGANIHTNVGVGFANQLAAIATKAE